MKVQLSEVAESTITENCTFRTSKPAHRTRPIRVLFVNDHLGYSGGVYHGVTTYFIDLLPRFNPNKVELSLCIFRNRHPASDQLEAKGIYPIFLNRAKWDPRVLMDLFRIIREHDIQVLHLSGMKGCLLGRVVAKMAGSRAIIELHDTTPLQPLVRFLHRRVAKWTDMALGVSKQVSELAVSEFRVPRDRVRTLYTGIPIEKYSGPSPGARELFRKNYDIDEDARVIGVVGRMMPMKGHKVLIRAMPSILAQCHKTVLVIAGDGPTREACEVLVNELALTHAVRFTGIVSSIPDTLSAIDVFALPSLFGEGFGKVALEALAAGKPVVGFPVPALPEFIVDGENGFLVPHGDSKKLGEALLRILTNPDLAKRMSQQCRGYVERFDISKHAERLERIYEAVVNGHEVEFDFPAFNSTTIANSKDGLNDYNP